MRILRIILLLFCLACFFVAPAAMAAGAGSQEEILLADGINVKVCGVWEQHPDWQVKSSWLGFVEESEARESLDDEVKAALGEGCTRAPDYGEPPPPAESLPAEHEGTDKNNK